MKDKEEGGTGIMDTGLRHASSAREDDISPRVRLSLLGGFRAEHMALVPESAWQQRRSAKTLVKLLATHPNHSLHREKVLDYLWPEVDPASALNSLGKALHVARRALEPGMPSRGTSSYLRLTDDVVGLVTEHMWIDADHFQTVAEEALRRGDLASLEQALALYTGELLPEDTYESWAVARRDALTDLHLRLLVQLADTLERRGDRDAASERLSQALHVDPTREDVHRRLMRVYAASGMRLQALRQYQLCCEVLQQELDVHPESATVELYEEIRTGRIEQIAVAVPPAPQHVEGRSLPPAIQRPPATPLFGRERVLKHILDDFTSAAGGHGQSIMVSGEVGVGKSRLVAEVAREAARQGALVLWGTSFEQESLLPYAPFAQALEAYVGRCDADERQLLAERYPELAYLVPSLGAGARQQPRLMPRETEQSQLCAAMIRVLTDLAENQAVMLVLDDLHAVSRESLQLLQYLAHLASHRRWLIIGTYREEDVDPGNDLQVMLTSGIRQGFYRHVNLRRLARHDCDKLVHALLQKGTPSPALLEQIYAVSLGNPLFAIELIGAMQGRDELALIDGAWHAAAAAPGNVPRQVGQLVNSRVKRMEDRAQKVLSLIAVADGDSAMSFDDLYLAACEAVDPELSEASLLDILESALESHILEERGDSYAFTHPLFRAALCEHLSRQRRMQLRAALAHAMEARRPNQVEILDRHDGENHGAETAARHLERSAKQAQVLGIREMEEAHLWELLERLHVLGRKADADRVRHNLRSLLQEQSHSHPTSSLASVDDTETAARIQDEIA